MDMYIEGSVCLCMFIFMNMKILIFIYTYMCVYAYIYMCEYIFFIIMYTYLYIHIYIYIFIWIHTRVLTYIWIYKFTNNVLMYIYHPEKAFFNVRKPGNWNIFWFIKLSSFEYMCKNMSIQIWIGLDLKKNWKKNIFILKITFYFLFYFEKIIRLYSLN
jgi:hypothetical protein